MLQLEQHSEVVNYTIIVLLVSIMLLFGFTIYISFRAQKTSLRDKFYMFLGSLFLWMLAKLCKLVVSEVDLYWIAIVLQFIGNCGIEYYIVMFALIYHKGEKVANKWKPVIMILPVTGLLLVLTNPLHHLILVNIYLENDSWGPLGIAYFMMHHLHIMGACILLIKSMHSHLLRHVGVMIKICLHIACIMAILINLLYFMGKLEKIPFLITIPIEGSVLVVVATIFLFIMPSLSFRFLDISPVSYQKLYQKLPRGIVLVNKKGVLNTPNDLFVQMFPILNKGYCSTYEFINSLSELDDCEKIGFFKFLTSRKQTEYLLKLKSHSYELKKQESKPQECLIYVIDVTHIVYMKSELENKNAELAKINRRLKESLKNSKELVATKAKATVAQNVHDILGHSLTVALCTAEVASMDKSREEAKQKLTIIEEVLCESVKDLKNSIQGNEIEFQQTSLVKAIKNLSNLKVELELTTQGRGYELNSLQNEVIFRTCQEAVTNAIKHGDAKSIYIFLRYYQDLFEVYIIDNGAGCKEIKKGCGLIGMEKRVRDIGGTFEFGSDGVRGFHIHVEIPRNKSNKS